MTGKPFRPHPKSATRAQRRAIRQSSLRESGGSATVRFGAGKSFSGEDCRALASRASRARARASLMWQWPDKIESFSSSFANYGTSGTAPERGKRPLSRGTAREP